jgi:hypothetical protein
MQIRAFCFAGMWAVANKPEPKKLTTTNEEGARTSGVTRS